MAKKVLLASFIVFVFIFGLRLAAIVCPEWKPRPLIYQINLLTNAVNKMEDGPPLALYRRSQQIALWC